MKSIPTIIKTSLLLLLPVLVSTFVLSNSEPDQVSASSDNFKSQNVVQDQVLVKYKNSTINLDYSDLPDKFQNVGGTVAEDIIPRTNIVVYKLDEGQTVDSAIESLQNNPDIESVQPNFKYYTQAISTDDTRRAELWGLDNSGQLVNGYSGTSDVDIDAPEAWSLYEGDDSIVAVIDTGTDYTHVDLAANMWDGSSCLDDLGAPLGGCLGGYDFQDDDIDPMPSIYNHGTHVSGTVGALKNNAEGIIGVAPNVQIMALKTALTTAEIVRAINFADYNGAEVINASWGGFGFDAALNTAIDGYSGLFVTVAGNETNDNDEFGFYPCAYTLDNILCVAATDQDDDLASFSSWGATTVDLAAPGVSILSTIGLSNTTEMYETFEGVTVPALPAGWSSTGDMETIVDVGQVLIGDSDTLPYTADADDYASSPSFDLSSNVGATLDFFTECDTEYRFDGWYDYMMLESSPDGATWNEIMRWDEPYLDTDIDQSGSASYFFSGVEIPTSDLTSTFKFRFRWITDSSDNNYFGCTIDLVRLRGYSSGADAYGFLNGTSMASPHAAGAAALLFDIDNFSVAQVKSLLMGNTDPVTALDGITVSGGRLNLEKVVAIAQNTRNSSQYLFPWNTGIGEGTYSAYFVSNPITNVSLANVEVLADGILKNTYILQPGDSVKEKITNYHGADIVIRTSNSTPIVANRRTFKSDLITDVNGAKANLLSTKYYFPWNTGFDSRTYTAYFISNPYSNINDAEVEVRIDGVAVDNYVIQPGDSEKSFQYTNHGGDVEIEAMNAVDIVVTRRTFKGTLITDVNGTSVDELSTKYYYPWNTGVDAGTFTAYFILNPSDNVQTADVEVYVDGILRDNHLIAPGESIKQLYTSDQGLDVVIESTNAVNIVTTRRTFKGSLITDVNGISIEQLNTACYYPWHTGIGTGTYSAYFILNPHDNVSTTTVEIRMNEDLVDSFSLNPGESVKKPYYNYQGADVEIKSTSNVTIAVTRRTFKGSLIADENPVVID